MRSTSTGAVLITGTPGVGKSTIAAKLARRFPLAAHIEADLLQRMIVSGGEWPSTRTETARQQLILRTRNAAILADSFQVAGIRPVIDDVVSLAEQLYELRRLLDHRSFTIVALTASDQVIRERDAAREKHTAANYLGVEALIRKTLGDLAHWVDTTDLNPEESAEIALQLIESTDE